MNGGTEQTFYSKICVEALRVTKTFTSRILPRTQEGKADGLR